MGSCCSGDTTTSKNKNYKSDDYDAFQLQYEDTGENSLPPSTVNNGSGPLAAAEAASPPRGSSSSPLANNEGQQSGPQLSATNRSYTPLYSPAGGDDVRSLYSVDDGRSVVSTASFAMSATSSNNVTANDVDKYIKGLDASFSMRGGGGAAGSSAASAYSQNSRQSGAGQLDECKTLQDLEVLESVKRSELYANFAITSKMIMLAAKRIVPTIRKKRAHTGSGKKALIVVHHQDISPANMTPRVSVGGGGDHMENSFSITASSTNRGMRKHHHYVDPHSTTGGGAGLDGSLRILGTGTSSPSGGSPRNRKGSDAGSVSPSATAGDQSPPQDQPPALGSLSPSNSGPTNSVGELQPQLSAPVFQMEGYSAMNIECDRKKFKPKARAVNTPSWDYLSEPDATEVLNRGDAMFKFICRTVKNFTPEDVSALQPLINMTGFKNQLEENEVPHLDFVNHKETGISLYTVIGVKTSYMLPGMKLEYFNKDLLTDPEYHRKCQPGPPKVEEKNPEFPGTFRITKTVIKFVCDVTIMMKVWEVEDPEMLKKLEVIDGMVPAKVLLLERTRRTRGKDDATVTTKTFLCHYPVTGGVLVTSMTMVVNKSIPRVVAPVVNAFGNQGAKEGAETAELTRAYLIPRFGDCRKDM